MTGSSFLKNSLKRLSFLRRQRIGQIHWSEWLKTNKKALVLDEEAVAELVTRVTEQGYADDLTDQEIEKIGRDPFLVAYALVDTQKRDVVTTEHSKETKTRSNRKLPDVCDYFNVRGINTFALIQELNFRTGWRGRS